MHLCFRIAGFAGTAACMHHRIAEPVSRPSSELFQDMWEQNSPWRTHTEQWSAGRVFLLFLGLKAVSKPADAKQATPARCGKRAPPCHPAHSRSQGRCSATNRNAPTQRTLHAFQPLNSSSGGERTTQHPRM